MIDSGQNKDEEFSKPASAETEQRGRVGKRLLALLAAGSLIILWGASWHGIESKRIDELSAIEARALGKAAVFAEHSISTIKRVNEVTIDLRDHWTGDATAFADLVSKRQEHIGDIAFQVAVIDRNGWLLFSNLGRPSTPTDLSQREHFLIHKNATDADRLFISKPVLGKVSGKWSIQFTRPIFKRGNFDGVMVVSVSPELFGDFAKSIVRNTNGSVTLVKENGEVMARYPANDSFYNTIIKDRPFQAAGAASSGFYRQLSASDDIERFFGYRKNPAYGLIFVVGEAAGEVLGAYYEYRTTVLGVAGLLSLLLIAVFLALYRNLSALDAARLKTLKANKRLQESQALLRSVIDNIADPIFIKNAEGRFVVANQALANAYGTTTDALIGKDDAAFGVPEEMAEALRQNIRRVLERGQTEITHEDARHALSGEIRHYESVNKPLTDAAGNQQVLVVSHDLTELMREHEKVQVREQRLREVLEATREGAWEWHVPTGEIIHNDQWFELLGFATGEVSGNLESFAQLIHEDDRPAVFQRIAALLNGDVENYESVHRLQGKDRLIWVHDRGRIAERDNQGAALRVVGSYMDITARHDAETRSADFLKQQQALLQSDAIGIALVRNRTFEWVNGTIDRMFGYTVSTLAGKPTRILYPSDEDFTAMAETAYPVINSGKVYRAQLEMLRWDGSRAWFELSGSRFSSDEKLSVWSIIDISQQKRYESELKTALQAADRASQAKSDFLATMSHEIRTPMNGVIGMTALLQGTELSKEQHEYAEMIRMSAENLLGLINDILDFSKIEAGKLEIDAHDFDLQTMLEDTADLLALRAEEAGLELICQIDPGVPLQLKGDSGRLRQVITNLVSNAIKFTPEGEVRIRVMSDSEAWGWVALRFEIKDTGIGIPKNRQAILFSPFTQVDGSTTRKYGGTGLGLAICKQLTELMGGQIGFESDDGEGSTFWFTACFEKRIENAALAPITPTPSARILVVDDNASTLKLTSSLLKRAGYPHQVADNAEAALALLREAKRDGKPFAVALLDQQMPGMNGHELGRRIKAEPLLEATSLVLLSPVGQQGNAAIAEKIGFVGSLTKPLRQAQLYDAIARALPEDGETGHRPKAEAISRPHLTVTAKQGFRILLVEDNVVNQKFAQTLLNKQGYQVDSVGNGLEAIRALERINYDLVLMDCQMPVMDGFSATAMIRDAGSKVLDHAVPIIAMTANAMTGDREKCLAVGMNDYISKPVDSRDLCHKIAGIQGQAKAKLPQPDVGTSPAGEFVNEENPDGAKLRNSAASAEEAVLDTELALDLMDGDRDALLLMLSIVRDQIMADRPEIASAISANDAGRSKTISHRLKGSLGQIGAVRAQKTCARIEAAAACDDLGIFPGLGRTLEAELDALSPAIDDYLANHRADSS